MKTKIIITGSAQHGKDTAAEFLRDKYQLPFKSSSYFALDKVIYPVLKDKYGYTTPDECFNDRDNHRPEWYELIVEYNTPVLTRLADELLETNVIYCGLRNIEEFNAIKQKYNIFSIWIEGDPAKKKEPTTSLTITADDCDYIVHNTKTLQDLYEGLDVLMESVLHHCEF